MSDPLIVRLPDIAETMSQPAKRNHYVPEWYQRRFLEPGETRFHRLDLSPPIFISPGGVKYQHHPVRLLGPPSCFVQDDLYTLKLGRWTTDAVEKGFFGPIDHNGRKAVEFFADYGYREGAHEAFGALMDYMNAQRFRTPRGLDWLKAKTDIQNQISTMAAMRALFRLYATMWTEGVWEVVSADKSPTKFLLTDEPVTFFNSRAFPLSDGCRYPNDVGLESVGTRTFFPLSRERLLIITHLQFVRDPRLKPLKERVNARAFQTPFPFDLRGVQTGRELEEDEVIRINLILKKRATRFIAAAKKEWLFPEEQASTAHWPNLDDDWCLLPNPYKVPFVTEFIAGGFKDRPPWISDEHGRQPEHPEYQDKKLFEHEWRQHNKAKIAWAIKREGRSISRVLEFDDVSNSIMRDALDAHHRERKRRGRGRQAKN